jgi:hypothetical protein
MQDGSYSDKDKQVGRVLKKSDGLYENECGVIMRTIQNGSAVNNVNAIHDRLVMKMVKVTEENYW